MAIRAIYRRNAHLCNLFSYKPKIPAVEYFNTQFNFMIKSVAHKLAWDGDSSIESSQGGSLAFFKALPHSDPTPGLKFPPFFYPYIQGAMRHCRRDELRASPCQGNNHRDLSLSIYDPPSKVTNDMRKRCYTIDTKEDDGCIIYVFQQTRKSLLHGITDHILKE